MAFWAILKYIVSTSLRAVLSLSLIISLRIAKIKSIVRMLSGARASSETKSNEYLLKSISPFIRASSLAFVSISAIAFACSLVRTRMAISLALSPLCCRSMTKLGMRSWRIAKGSYGSSKVGVLVYSCITTAPSACLDFSLLSGISCGVW